MCDSSAHFNVWCAIPSARVETRNMRIPRLPRKQMLNAILWTFSKTADLNRQEELLDYEIIEDVVEGGVKKTEVMAYKAPIDVVTEFVITSYSIHYTKLYECTDDDDE